MSYDLSADPAVIEQPDIDLTPLPTPPRMPKVGETVIFYQGDLECAQEAGFGGIFDKMMEIGRHKAGCNGTRFHPAIVTRVWSHTCVNLMVLFDAKGPSVRTSMTLLPQFESDVHCTQSGWRFAD